MTREEFITELNNILEELKENSENDITQYAFEKTVYSVEAAIEYLIENEVNI